jgi:hypothetical protein
MLEYKNNLLKYLGDSITSANQIIYLDTDVAPTTLVFGELLLTNGSSIVIEFVNSKDNIYTSKLSLTEDVKQYLIDSTFKLILVDSDNTQETNLIKFNFNLEKITFDLKKTQSDSIKQLYKKITSLESILNHLVKSHVIESPTILNKDYIKKGMMLQAIDDNGNFVAVYPFVDVVKEVNGQKAINSSINLDASMIKYNQMKYVSEVISDISDAVRALNSSLKTQGDILKDLQDEVSDIKLQLQRHLNDGII